MRNDELAAFLEAISLLKNAEVAEALRDPMKLYERFSFELASRGINTDAAWIGFDKANQEHEQRMKKIRITTEQE